MNVGPKHNGAIQKGDAKLLHGVGEWLRTNGEAIYGSQCCDLPANSVSAWTRKGNVGYIILPCWVKDELIHCHVATKPKSAELLGSKKKLNISHDPKTGRLVISGLPKNPPHPDVSVIKVVFGSRPRVMKARDRSAWLGVKA